jgi:hypothetical protein
MATNAVARVEDKGIRAFKMKSVSAAIILANELPDSMLYECDSGALSRLESLFTRTPEETREFANNSGVLRPVADKIVGNMASSFKVIANHEGLPEELLWFWYFTLCAELYEDANKNTEHIIQATSERTIIHHFVFKHSHLCRKTVDTNRNANYLMALIYLLACSRSQINAAMKAAMTKDDWKAFGHNRGYGIEDDPDDSEFRDPLLKKPLCGPIVPIKHGYNFPCTEGLIKVGGLWSNTQMEILRPLAIYLSILKSGNDYGTVGHKALCELFMKDWIDKGCPDSHPALGLKSISFAALLNSKASVREAKDGFLKEGVNYMDFIKVLCKQLYLEGFSRLPGHNEPLAFAKVLADACQLWEEFFDSRMRAGGVLCELATPVSRYMSVEVELSDPRA